jgi:hypothetical protein
LVVLEVTNLLVPLFELRLVALDLLRELEDRALERVDLAGGRQGAGRRLTACGSCDESRVNDDGFSCACGCGCTVGAADCCRRRRCRLATVTACVRHGGVDRMRTIVGAILVGRRRNHAARERGR